MTVKVAKIDRGQIYQLISGGSDDRLTSKDVEIFRSCLALTSSLWIGQLDGKFVCCWGLMPPTMLSQQAYLWLYTNEALVGHEFLFIRHSQVAVEKMLEEFPVIYGHTKVELVKAVRWLKWLGAEFGEPIGGIMPFTIRKNNG